MRSLYPPLPLQGGENTTAPPRRGKYNCPSKEGNTSLLPSKNTTAPMKQKHCCPSKEGKIQLPIQGGENMAASPGRGNTTAPSGRRKHSCPSKKVKIPLSFQRGKTSLFPSENTTAPKKQKHCCPSKEGKIWLHLREEETLLPLQVGENTSAHLRK